MTEAEQHIPIKENSELGRPLDEANGHSHRLSPQARSADDPWKDYDPEVVKRALATSAGAFAGMDTKRLKRELRRQRGQDSRGRPA